MRNCALAVTFLCLALAQTPAQTPTMPHLEHRGQATQLIVDGKPFLMLGGELHNSSSSSLAYMAPLWPRLAAIPGNTFLTPISWELVEPTEGRYDFALIDGLLAQARENHLHLVLLWLAAWKNGLSSYPPVWVKSDTKRFPRVILHGEPAEILSTISGPSDALRDADAKALAAVMAHLQEVDTAHTVLMIQVENEVGILGDARDHSPAADKAFAGPVPAQLTQYLKAHRDTLDPELRVLLEANGDKPSGSWTAIFGDSARADEAFMAWNYARYVQHVTAAGKAAYPIPLYVNTWLGGNDATPGQYPSGGPQPRVIDIWRAAGNALDFYAPDLYKAEFAFWAERYHRDGNPLFLPETNGAATGAANVFIAVGEHAALGFCPFAIDSFPEGTADLGQSYAALQSIAPQLLEAQSRGEVHGFTLSREHSSVEWTMQGYTVHVSLDDIFGNRAQAGYGLVMSTGPNEFLGVGKGFRVLVSPREPSPYRLGFGSIDEGTYKDGTWTPGRRLNGDENDQGQYWRFDPRAVKVEKATVYRFR